MELIKLRVFSLTWSCEKTDSFIPVICLHTCICLMTEGTGQEGCITHSIFIPFTKYSPRTHPQTGSVPGTGVRVEQRTRQLLPSRSSQACGERTTITIKCKQREVKTKWEGGEGTVKTAWLAQRISQLLNPGLQALWQVPWQVNSIIFSQRIVSLSQLSEWQGNKSACGSHKPYLFARHYRKAQPTWWRSLFPDTGNHVPMNHSTPHSHSFSSHISFNFELGVDKTVP